MTIIEGSNRPIGTYGCLYYAVSERGIRRRADGDRGLSLAQAEDAARRLGENEVMVATCQSQTGGFVAFGSVLARLLWQEADRREAEKRRLAEEEKRAAEWTARGDDDECDEYA